MPFGGTRNETTTDFLPVQVQNLAILRKQFGQRVRQIRDELGKTQEEFAELMGMSVDFLSLIERGRNSPSFRGLERMANRLGKPVAYLFLFDDRPSSRIERRAKASRTK